MYHDEAKMDRCVTIIITGLGLCIILGPLWILRTQSAEIMRLGTISGSLAIFLALLSIVTVAKPFETLAAVAA